MESSFHVYDITHLTDVIEKEWNDAEPSKPTGNIMPKI